MSDDKMNSAEREAEEILKGAYAEARAEECPQGEDCPIHFRVDEEYFEDGALYARMITYMGDYVVITEDNPELGSPNVILKAVLGTLKKGDVKPWETAVYHVGKGAIADIESLPVERQRETLRYSYKHDVWDRIRTEHEVVVFMLRDGLIDVSKPISE